MLTCYLKLGKHVAHIFSDYYSHLSSALCNLNKKIEQDVFCYISLWSVPVYIAHQSFRVLNSGKKKWCVMCVINVVCWHQICLFIRFGSISEILKIVLWLASVYGYINFPDCCSRSRRNEIIPEAVACVCVCSSLQRVLDKEYKTLTCTYLVSVWTPWPSE